MARKRDEPVRLTRIYTRTGDTGETSLGDMSRVSKLDPRIAASEQVEINPLVPVYLNRLSDLLFILARTANSAAGVAEPLWKPGGDR